MKALVLCPSEDVIENMLMTSAAFRMSEGRPDIEFRYAICDADIEGARVLQQFRGWLENDRIFMVLRSDAHMPVEDWCKVFAQAVLGYPVVFIHPSVLPYRIVEEDRRDWSLANIRDKNIIYIDTGMYILPREIFKYLEYIEAGDTISSVIMKMLRMERLACGSRKERKKQPHTNFVCYPLRRFDACILNLEEK